jgi:hypothetical protein
LHRRLLVGEPATDVGEGKNHVTGLRKVAGGDGALVIRDWR